MSQPTHDPALTALERALAGLAPSAEGLNRDALMFAAGRASARRGWAWPCAAATAGAAAVLLAALLLLRPNPPAEVRYVEVPVPPVQPDNPAPAAPDESPEPEATPAPPPASPLRPEIDYLTLRQQVERWGDAALPRTPAADEGPAPSGALLDLPPGTGADPWLQRRKAMLNPGGPL
jgi:hypothetical protein